VCKTNAGVGFQASLFTRPNDPPLPPASLCGLMIRSSKDPSSPFVFVGVSPQRILAIRRDATGAFWTTNAPLQRAYENPRIILRFEQRTNNQVVPSYSFDHQRWTSFQDYAFSLSPQSLVGFTVCSGNNSNRIAAHFSDQSTKSDTTAIKK
jgi:hypothetical protein